MEIREIKMTIKRDRGTKNLRDEDVKTDVNISME